MKDEGWFNVAGIGCDGCEMLVSTTDSKEATGRVVPMELRARLNSHRSIRIYTWKSNDRVGYDDLKTKKQRAAIMAGATNVF